MSKLLKFAWAILFIVVPVMGQEGIVISNVTVVDPIGVMPARTVTISEGIIADVSPAESEVISDAVVVDGTGKYVIPGLWDMHTYLSKGRPSALTLLVAHGVTGVRDMGGDHAELVQWREQIQSGERVEPRIVMAGPYLESASNVLRQQLENQVEPTGRTRIGISNPDMPVLWSIRWPNLAV